MPAISVDLASGNYSDVGVVVLTRSGSEVLVSPVDLPAIGLSGKPNAEKLARFLVEFAEELGVTAIGLDGPQGWKSAGNGLQHSRVCEAKLATQGKTGTPGVTKPGNYLGFISFCVDTFDALAELGWTRYTDSTPVGVRVAVETFPTAAWKSLGLRALPGKSKSKGQEVEDWSTHLIGLGNIRLLDGLTHDQLQAAVSGLGVLALSEGRRRGFIAVGVAPFQEGPHWLEGFIINPLVEESI